jgi:tRNA (guanine-N7-)-methyltransferase
MPIANPYSTKLGDFPDLIIDTLHDDNRVESSKLVNEVISKFPKVAVELGSGSGEHLVSRASQDPNTLYIGIEIRFKRIYRTAQKAVQSNLKNILLIRIFAEDIESLFVKNSLDIIYINFPDPWAKRRWLKHRLVSDSYLVVLRKLLKNDGIFSFKTDHPDYFAAVETSLGNSAESWKILKKTNDLYKSPWINNNIPTEFEKLFLSKGLPVNFLEATPIGDL